VWSRDVWNAVAFRAGRWFFFTFLLALLPIALGALEVETRARETFSIQGLVGAGELLLVTAAVVGAALADLIGDAGAGFRTTRLYCGCSAAVVVIAAATWFADVNAAQRDGAALDRHSITVGSIWILGAALVAALSCLVVVEASKHTEGGTVEGDSA
jgi:hypothetical protein